MTELVPTALTNSLFVLLIVFIIVINTVSAIVCVIDKINAKKHKQRIPEAVLLWLSVFGGALLMLITMLLIRHKTKKPKFMIGLPVILLLQVLLVLLFYV